MKALERRLAKLEAATAPPSWPPPIAEMDDDALAAVVDHIDGMAERKILALLGGEPDSAELAAVSGQMEAPHGG